MLEQIKAEAARQDRSLSWIVQKAWKIARTDIQSIPLMDDRDRSGDEPSEP